MKMVALLTVRNQELCLERCLEHSFFQGIETCFIDDNSTDKSREVAERFLKRGVFRLERQPYLGYYDHVGLLSLKENLADNINADWFIHHDTDEIMEAPSPFASLRAGIESADAAGFEAINFDEFVFVPTANTENYEGTDYVEKIQYFYFFEPGPNRQVAPGRSPPVSSILRRVEGIALIFPPKKYIRKTSFLDIIFS